MVKYHFITFATENYLKDAQELCDSAFNKGGFDTVKIYNFDHIDPVFSSKNNHILTLPRGAGYWLWKPYIIQKHLLEIDDGDILCYCDSSYLFLNNIRSVSDIWLSNKNIGIAQNKPNGNFYRECEYTKFDTLVLMNVSRNLHASYRNSYQAWAGFFLTRKCLNSIRFIGEWLTYAQDFRTITDVKSTFGPEDSNFIDNRHDQSILSILLKKWDIPMHVMDKYFLFNKRMPL
jgi:hypothetical protein